MRPPLEIESGPVRDGHAVTANGSPAKTPAGRPLVVPSAALAREIADEIGKLLAADPGALKTKAVGDPAAAPNFRIAAGAIDVIAGEPGARARIIADLAGYGETDLLCFRAERPQSLVEAEAQAWDPLLAWFAEEFGARLHVTEGVRAEPQPQAALDAITAAVEAADDFALAALSLAVRAAGSIVIGLALDRGRLDADGALAASAIEEHHQAERWGSDAEATAALEAKALDLAHAARFLHLLAEE